MARVLHVTDCLNAGISTALESIFSTELSHEHQILYDFHSDAPLSIPSLGNENSCSPKNIFWGNGYFAKYINLKKVIRNFQPNIIHAHSTLAGIYVRVFAPRQNIYYSPHCFAFQRLDLPVIIRKALYLLEYSLDHFTNVRVAHWPIEESIFLTFPRKLKTLRKPLFDIQELIRVQEKRTTTPRPERTNETFVVGFVGRVRPQKDPEIFANISKILCDDDIVLIWVGQGDKKLERILKDANVEIVPWASKSRKHELFQEMDCLIVPSLWESGPLVLFEALSEGVPALLRRSEYAKTYGLPQFDTAEEFAKKILELKADKAHLAQLSSNQLLRFKFHEFFANKDSIYD